MPILIRACNDCSARFDVLSMSTWKVFIDTGEDFDGQCIDCDSKNLREIIGVGVGIELGGEAGVGKIYPYDDRALGCRVSSKKHRDQIMKARGLRPLDGDHDFEREQIRDRDQRQGYRDKFKALNKRYDTDPNFAEHRRLRDKGWYQDQQAQSKTGR